MGAILYWAPTVCRSPLQGSEEDRAELTVEAIISAWGRGVGSGAVGGTGPGPGSPEAPRQVRGSEAKVLWARGHWEELLGRSKPTAGPQRFKNSQQEPALRGRPCAKEFACIFVSLLSGLPI